MPGLPCNHLPLAVGSQLLQPLGNCGEAPGPKGPLRAPCYARWRRRPRRRDNSGSGPDRRDGQQPFGYQGFDYKLLAQGFGGKGH